MNGILQNRRLAERMSSFMGLSGSEVVLCCLCSLELFGALGTGVLQVLSIDNQGAEWVLKRGSWVLWPAPRGAALPGG